MYYTPSVQLSVKAFSTQPCKGLHNLADTRAQPSHTMHQPDSAENTAPLFAEKIRKFLLISSGNAAFVYANAQGSVVLLSPCKPLNLAGDRHKPNDLSPSLVRDVETRDLKPSWGVTSGSHSASSSRQVEVEPWLLSHIKVNYWFMHLRRITWFPPLSD